jgi:hypothetical protein
VASPQTIIQVLIDKSLIKVGDYRVRMHDMIEDMGREIVRLEAPSKPGKRSRLWFSTDILHVFKENKVREGIIIYKILILFPFL